MINNHKRKISPCLNCGRYGHEQKECIEPVTSWGIILVNPNNENLKYFCTDLNKYNSFDGIAINNKDDLKIAAEIMTKIKFLLVRRKHSLGFSEFIRGKYKVGNINGIRGLFRQMTPNEIEMIKISSFDDLWDYFWGVDSSNFLYGKKDYSDSKEKFDELKSKRSLESDLDFYIDTANPSYSLPEWGFPKGRKKRGESDMECALREFTEETGMSESDIRIIEDVKPIKEIHTGTNGVKYRHIYFLAEALTDKAPYIDKNNKMLSLEIGDIGFFTYNECLEKLRDYHVEKKEILKCIMNYYTDLIKNKKNIINSKDNEWKVDSADNLYFN